MRNQDTLPSDLPWIQSDECLEMASTKLILDSIPCLNCDYDQQSPLLVEIQSRIKHRSVKKNIINGWTLPLKDYLINFQISLKFCKWIAFHIPLEAVI